MSCKRTRMGFDPPVVRRRAAALRRTTGKAGRLRSVLHFTSHWTTSPSQSDRLETAGEYEGQRHRLSSCSSFASVSGRNHSETCVGCIVPLTTVKRSSLKASRSVSWFSVAEKASNVFLASYLLR
jgi:hypothetical protein